MAQEKYKSLESFYTGSYGPLDPTYGPLFIGYRVPTSEIGSPTSIKTGNQIAEVSSRLSEGMKTIELQPFSSEMGTPGVEVMPKQHWTEIKQLGKLAGATFSLHVPPSIDPAGFTERGWSESVRQQSEIQFKKNIERAHEIDINGNIPVVIHATSGIPSMLAPKPEEAPITEEDMVNVVSRESGQLTGIRRERRYDPEKGYYWINPEEQIREQNRKVWDRTFSSIAWENYRAGDIISGTAPIIQPVLKDIKEKRIDPEELLPEQRRALDTLSMGQVIYDDIGAHLRTFYNDANRLWDEKTREKHKDELEKIKNNLNRIQTENLTETNPIEATKRYNEVIRRFQNVIKEDPPEIYQSTDKFSRDKTKETIANTALHGYQKFGEKAPMIAVENFFAGTIFSEGEELANLIKDSRKEFIEKARDSGVNESRAREAANKLIGATWDTGHIGLLRKFGLGEKKGKYDEKEFKKIIAAQTRAVAPFVKHAHLTDNFGFADSHLPPGMGDMPIKEVLRELEKAGFSGKKIIEAAALPVIFKTSPVPPTLEALGSPLYGMDMQPYWNQVRGVYGIPGGYSAGYGMMLPEQHVGTYGAGFASLPMELGGQMPGKGKRFSGTPME